MEMKEKRESALVKISYSVKISEVPFTLSGLLRKRVAQPLEDFISLLKERSVLLNNLPDRPERLKEVLRAIEEIREQMFDLDNNLADIYSLHSAYLEYLQESSAENKQDILKEVEGMDPNIQKVEE